MIMFISRSGILLFMVVLLWIACAYSIVRDRAQTEQAAEQNSRNLARACEEMMVRSLRAVDQALLYVRQLYSTNPQGFDITPWQRDNQFLTEFNFQVSIADKDGRVVASNLAQSGAGIGIDVSDREHFRAQRDSSTDEMFISKPVFGRLSNKWSINVSRRIAGPDGAFAGIVVVSLDPEYLTNFYRSIDVGHEGSITLVGTDGIVRSRASENRITTGASLLGEPLFEALKHADVGSFTRPSAIDGTDRMFSYRKVAGYPLVVVIGVGTEDLFAMFRQHRLSLLLIVSALTLIISGMAWRLRQNEAALVESLAQLSEREQLASRKSWQLHEAVSNISQGILMADHKGDIQVINRRVVELLGLPEDYTFRPLTFADIHEFQVRNGEYRDIEGQLGSQLGQAIGAGRPAETPPFYEYDRPNGTVLAIRTTNLRGGGLVRTYADVTWRKQVERAIAEARDGAELASRAQATFLAMMSHELRTPMNAVIGLTSMLIETPLDETQRRYARTINTSAEQLLAIINNILDFSRLDSGREKPEIVTFDLLELVDDMIAIVHSLPRAGSIAVSADIGPDVPTYLSGDRSRLTQVLLNFLGNAVKYTLKGTVRLVVTLTARRETEAMLRFGVIDTGIGISADVLAKLFKPFERGDMVDAPQFGGTGLGLAISKRVVEMLGGTISAESTVGVGSTFCCDIPFRVVKPSDVRDHAPAIERKRPSYSLRILVAEDTPASQQVIEAILEKLGHRVQLAANGAEALVLAKETNVDLILMDMQMPVMDGCQAATLIRRIDGPKGRVPIVALTAFAQPADRERALSAGMNDYLRKPIRKADVEALLGRLFAVDDSHAEGGADIGRGDLDAQGQHVGA
jgi:signal transduction histidine kinase/ActR/RegA family two-component response regulator